jgi:PAS domain S-box-containing protein
MNLASLRTLLSDLPPAHRMARTNYRVRASSFAFSFLLVVALALERTVSGAVFAYAAVALLAYPHLAYLWARAAFDSRQAELGNLLVDGALLAILMAELGLPLWPSCGVLLAVCVNNAICGGGTRLACAAVLMVCSAALWMVWSGETFAPSTGLLVTYLSIVGIVGYASAVGLVVHGQNRHLVRTREVLRESEQQFRFVAENAGDLVAVLDSYGRFIYASNSYPERFDHLKVVPGADWCELLDPSERERAKAFLASLLRLKIEQRERFRMVTAAGETVTMRCKGNPVHDRDDAVPMMVVISHEEAPAPAQRTRGDTLPAAGLAVLITDHSGTIVFASEQVADIIGFGAAEVLGKTVEAFFRPLYARSLFQPVSAAVQESGSWKGRLLGVHRNGQLRRVEASVARLLDRELSGAHYAWHVSEVQLRVAANSAAQ